MFSLEQFSSEIIYRVFDMLRTKHQICTHKIKVCFFAIGFFFGCFAEEMFHSLAEIFCRLAFHKEIKTPKWNINDTRNGIVHMLRDLFTTFMKSTDVYFDGKLLPFRFTNANANADTETLITQSHTHTQWANITQRAERMEKNPFWLCYCAWCCRRTSEMTVKNIRNGFTFLLFPIYLQILCAYTIL